MSEPNVLGVRVDDAHKEQLEQEILELVKTGKREVLAYVNIHAVNIAQHDARFRMILNRARRAYCDGEGVRLGARILGHTLPKRVVLTYWVWDLCALFEKAGVTIFLIGGKQGVVEKAASTLLARFPGLRIVGKHHGYFSKTGKENDAVIAAIEEAAPDVLFVGFGMPLQEYWIEENLHRLRTHVILPSGSMIDYVAGNKRTTPAWMADHGMEWLYRLTKEPGRLWKRYLIGNPKFLLDVLLERARRTLTHA